ncbi:c-type cytochrome [Pollutimonas thiosulfatoxidans]|uniref:Cytochrome c domain-containing protein n=1 Tax=Pollutimonas thiosulfatoxidans TaxID=2028345 RepID=A0A410GFM3_9BURK|nr:cytochrome c [Pollutimonas thiosulfatoxidans]QAA95045.1 hypothetical protein CKA81_15140 [Pollutimonas thiosulfatoxidans]
MKQAFTTFFRSLIVGLTCLVWMDGVQAAGDPPALTGEDVYRQYCMACHMVGGKGAEGAGRYPALAENPRLIAPGYPIYVVLNGQGAMPWFNGILADEEIAAVVGYIRTHFGNDYPGAVKADEVASMRGPVPKE